MEDYINIQGFANDRFVFQIDRKIRSPKDLKLDIARNIFVEKIIDEDDIFIFDDRIKICLFPSNIHLPKEDHSKYFHLKNIDRIYYSCQCISAYDNFRRDDHYIIFRLSFDNQILYVELNYFKGMKKRDTHLSIDGYAFISTDPNLFTNLVFESKKTFTKEKGEKTYYQSLLEDNVNAYVDQIESLRYFGPDKEAICKSLKEDEDDGGNNNKEICNIKEEYKENMAQTEKMRRKVMQDWEYDERIYIVMPKDSCCGINFDKRKFPRCNKKK